MLNILIEISKKVIPEFVQELISAYREHRKGVAAWVCHLETATILLLLLLSAAEYVHHAMMERSAKAVVNEWFTRLSSGNIGEAYSLLTVREQCPTECTTKAGAGPKKCAFRCSTANFASGYPAGEIYSVTKMDIGPVSDSGAQGAEQDFLAGFLLSRWLAHFPKEGSFRNANVYFDQEMKRARKSSCLTALGYSSPCDGKCSETVDELQQARCFERLPWTDGGNMGVFTGGREQKIRLVFEKGHWRLDKQKSIMIFYYPHGRGGLSG